jgi:hypothetical protein
LFDFRFIIAPAVVFVFAGVRRQIENASEQLGNEPLRLACELLIGPNPISQSASKTHTVIEKTEKSQKRSLFQPIPRSNAPDAGIPPAVHRLNKKRLCRIFRPKFRLANVDSENKR